MKFIDRAHTIRKGRQGAGTMSIFTWKRAFFGLLTFILLVLLAVFVYIANLWSAGDERHYQPAEIVEAESLFTVQTDRNRLNLLIASQLNSQEQDMPYAVELSEEVVQFRSSLRILGQHIPVTIDFFSERCRKWRFTT